MDGVSVEADVKRLRLLRHAIVIRLYHSGCLTIHLSFDIFAAIDLAYIFGPAASQVSLLLTLLHNSGTD
jgi:hypothetical protein